MIDARTVTDFAAGHLPGSLSIELRPVFASWLGWLTDLDQILEFVLDRDQDEADLVRQALTVGHDNLAGRLDGGIDAWTTAGLPLEATELIEPVAVRLAGAAGTTASGLLMLTAMSAWICEAVNARL